MKVVEVNDVTLKVQTEWVCACSGDGHPPGEPNAKCYRKGGHDVEVLHRLTGEEVGQAFPTDYAKEYVNRYGWQATGLTARKGVDGWPATYLIRPGVTL